MSYVFTAGDLGMTSVCGIRPVPVFHCHTINNRRDTAVNHLKKLHFLESSLLHPLIDVSNDTTLKSLPHETVLTPLLLVVTPFQWLALHAVYGQQKSASLIPVCIANEAAGRVGNMPAIAWKGMTDAVASWGYLLAAPDTMRWLMRGVSRRAGECCCCLVYFTTHMSGGDWRFILACVPSHSPRLLFLSECAYSVLRSTFLHPMRNHGTLQYVVNNYYFEKNAEFAAPES
ncbi:unnamed protein product [Hydatigera taeniaeformis]|uniref:Solute carrier family 40 protein n=1 Tax=Hydatigena taeniaeformis TaxID=6205 RepID=A0A0R3XCC9_HYDTA|nr:unnamed protein product [Hydatigera taeniaeformis]